MNREFHFFIRLYGRFKPTNAKRLFFFVQSDYKGLLIKSVRYLHIIHILWRVDLFRSTILTRRRTLFMN